MAQRGVPTAAGQDWYDPGTLLTVNGYRYVRFGYPRRFVTVPPAPGAAPYPLIQFGSYDGVDVFAQPLLEPYPRFIWIRLGSDCEFSPYAEVQEVR